MRQAELFSAMALVWHLVEILFIEVYIDHCTCDNHMTITCSLCVSGAACWVPRAAASGVGVLGRTGRGEGTPPGHS